MTLEEARQVISFLGIEDTSGLWEITWEPAFHEMPAEERIQFARRVLTDLLSEGMITLFRCQEPYGDLDEIGQAEWDAVLSTSETWQEPLADDISIRFATTPEGEAVYWAKEGS